MEENNSILIHKTLINQNDSKKTFTLMNVTILSIKITVKVRFRK